MNGILTKEIYCLFTERYCDIPIRRLEDDFPTYAKVAKKGIMDTLSMDTDLCALITWIFISSIPYKTPQDQV
jgi:hypothetical protein